MATKRILGYAVACALAVSGAPAWAETVELSFGQLDAVTAGSADGTMAGMGASGGAVVGNGSSATIDQLGGVDLSSEAQRGATALNLINSSESAVANGVNIWTSGGIGDGLTSIDSVGLPQDADIASFDLNQSNEISQEQRRMAMLPGYSRSEGNVSDTWDDSGSSAFSNAHDELHTVANTLDTADATSTTNSGSVDTQSEVVGQTFKGGRGLAASGEVDVNFDAGDVSITAKGGIGGDAVSAEVSLTIGLPALDVAIKGSGCVVMGGNCEATGTTNHNFDEQSDNSTHDSLVTAADGSDSVTAVGTHAYRSPVDISGAAAEYIVVDESSLAVASAYTVNLTDSAQADMRGMNIVNAAGSSVANGVNVAVGSQMASLTQSNVINHSR